ncbi:hypothetical protein LCGC14_1119400 [marine sediment metagenome]|uniref:Uncharacterized protein n=1 Tax=marine sediment metagenome TaxID=412755 RepID=A0A0F9MSA4_9ZZZZ
MLRVEKLICKDPKFFKGCKWRRTTLKYPDENLALLESRLEKMVLKTGVACRIFHSQKGLLLTIKKGHDKKLFVQDYGNLPLTS